MQTSWSVAGTDFSFYELFLDTDLIHCKNCYLSWISFHLSDIDFIMKLLYLVVTLFTVGHVRYDLLVSACFVLSKLSCHRLLLFICQCSDSINSGFCSTNDDLGWKAQLKIPEKDRRIKTSVCLWICISVLNSVKDLAVEFSNVVCNWIGPWLSHC